MYGTDFFEVLFWERERERKIDFKDSDKIFIRVNLDHKLELKPSRKLFYEQGYPKMWNKIRLRSRFLENRVWNM